MRIEHACATSRSEHGIRLPDALTDGWPPQLQRHRRARLVPLPAALRRWPGPACAARPTCAGSCARRPRTTPPRGRAGSSSRSTRRRTPRSSVASPRPSRSSSTRRRRPSGARPGPGSASSSRPAGCATPSRPAPSPGSRPSTPVTAPGTVVGFGLSQRRAARARRRTSRRPSPSPGGPASRSCPTAASCSAPQSVVETLEHLGPDRLGHGVRGVEDPQVLDARGRVGRDPRGLPRQQRRPRGLRRPGAGAAAGASSTPASRSRSGPTTRCCSAPGSPRSTRWPATSSGFDDAELAPASPGRASRAAGRRRPSGRPPSPTSTPGWRAEPPAPTFGLATSDLVDRPTRKARLDRHEDLPWPSCPQPSILLAGCASPAAAASHPVAARGHGGRRRRRATAPRRPARRAARPRRRPTSRERDRRRRADEPSRRRSPTSNQTITDPDLKDSITVKRLARALPWPAGYKASAPGVRARRAGVTWTPSKDYTIPIRKQDFAINTRQPVPQHPGPDRQRRDQDGRVRAAAGPGRQGRPGHRMAGVQGRPAQRSEADAGLHPARRADQRNAEPRSPPRRSASGSSAEPSV